MPGLAPALAPAPEFIVLFSPFDPHIREQSIYEMLGFDSAFHGRPLQIFKQLNAVAADLDATQRNRVEKSEHVIGVFKNEIRSLDPHAFASQSVEGPSPPSDEPASLTWGLRAIGIKDVWNGPTGRGIRVAILDSGIDLTHPDFEGRLISSRSFVPGEGPSDEDGHGTHCAGIIGGPATSMGGTRYGVAPDAALLIGKVLKHDFPSLGKTAGYDSWILEGVDWAVDSGARIVSLSLASQRSEDVRPSDIYERISEELLRAVPGVLIVAAAGNASSPSEVKPVCDPAACDAVLAVSAINENGRIASFSCGTVGPFGCVNIAAPGVNVYSAWNQGKRFATLSGTSMAAPHVSGVAALYLEEEPGLSAREVRQKLLNDAKRDEEISDIFGVGVVRVK